jgi:YhcH/YjgK/YiaL family protein
MPEVLAKPRTEYDVKNDVLFYHVDMSHATLIQNVPGQFMILFPGEVHGAGIWINNTVEHVKKAVIKVERETFFNFNG